MAKKSYISEWKYSKTLRKNNEIKKDAVERKKKLLYLNDNLK